MGNSIEVPQKVKIKHHMIQQSYSWTNAQKKLYFEKIHVPLMFTAALFTIAKT